MADLDMQESDSEDDKNDRWVSITARMDRNKFLQYFRLNCAILNDSFIMSPSKLNSLDFADTPLKTSKSDENNKNTINDGKDSGVCSGFLSDLPRSKYTAEETPKADDHLKISYRPLKSRTQLFPSKTVLQEKSKEPSVPSVFQKFHKDETDSTVPGSEQSRKALELIAPEMETPFKKTDQHLFATPSLRPPPQPFSTATVMRANDYFHDKLREATSEQKPQAKILFTTPIARPPPGSLIKSTPMDALKSVTHKKLSPIKEPSTEKEKPNERTITINHVDYVLDRKIGSGGSSTVFLARGKNVDKEYAIKLVKLDGDQQVIDGYLNETKLLAKLQGNVCVVSLFDYCHLPEKNILYMVMEKGESDLHKILQGFRTQIPLYTLLNYWYEMLQAVNYIHQNGVIHSDLKPANFLMIGGRLKLIDFGIASNIALDSTSIIKFSQAGTFNYISPEALIDTSSGDSPSTHHQPRIRLSTRSDVGC